MIVGLLCQGHRLQCPEIKTSEALIALSCCLAVKERLKKEQDDNYACPTCLSLQIIQIVKNMRWVPNSTPKTVKRFKTISFMTKLGYRIFDNLF